MRQKNLDNETVISMYTEQHLSLREIGELCGMTGAAIHRRLKKAGVTARQGELVQFNCAFCGKLGSKYRSQAKDKTQLFCNTDCYGASRTKSRLQNTQRLSRIEVRKYMEFQDGWVIDYKDGNNTNNDISNLLVFASEEDKRRRNAPLDLLLKVNS